MIRWKALIRDVIIIFVLTFLGGYVIGIAVSGGNIPMAAVGLSNIIFSAVGFTISGCLIKHNRFNHLLHVAIAVWLFSAINMLHPKLGIKQWLFGLLALILPVLVGWGASYLIVKEPKEE